MTYISSNASFSSIFRNLEAFSLTVWMFLISFPYRLALSHCHGLFFVIWLGQFPFFFFDCPSEEGAHSCFETSWEKSETKSSVKKIFLLLSRLNCLLSRDKNLINHDFHRRRLREVKFIQRSRKNFPLFCFYTSCQKGGVCVCGSACRSVMWVWVKVRMCQCVSESAWGRVTNFFFCLYSSCVRECKIQCALVVVVILKGSTFLAVISDCSTVRVDFPLPPLLCSLH